MAKVLILGDIHGNIADFRWVLEQESHDRVFLLGDYIGDIMNYCSVEAGEECLDLVQELLETEGNIAIQGNHEYMCWKVEAGKGHEKHFALMKNLPMHVLTHVDSIGIFLGHDPEDAEHAPQMTFRAKIICSGHLHNSGILKRDGKIHLQLGTLMNTGRSPSLASALHGSSLAWATEDSGRVYAIIDTDEMVVQIKCLDRDIEGETVARVIRETSISDI